MEEYFKRLREFRYTTVEQGSSDDLGQLIARYLLFLEAKDEVSKEVYKESVLLCEPLNLNADIDFFLHQLWLLNAINRYRCYVLKDYKGAYEGNLRGFQASLQILNQEIAVDEVEKKGIVLIFYFNIARLNYFLGNNELAQNEALAFLDLILKKKKTSEFNEFGVHSRLIENLIGKLERKHQDYYIGKAELLLAKIASSEESLHSILIKRFKEQLNDPFVFNIDQDKEYSYGEIGELVLKTESFLRSHLLKNERFLLLLIEDRLLQLLLLFSCWKMGVVPLFGNDQIKENDLKNIRLNFLDENELLVISDSKEKKLISLEMIEREKNVNSSFLYFKQDYALGLFTSGTTKSPKLCFFSHQALLKAAEIEKHNFDYSRVHSILNLRPHFTSAGTNHLWPAFLMNKKIVLATKLAKVPLWLFLKQTLEKAKIDLLIASPTYLLELLRNNDALENKRNDHIFLFFGGGKLSYKNRDLLKRLGFLPSMRYGMTEFAHVISRVDYWDEKDLTTEVDQDVGNIYHGVIAEPNKQASFNLSSLGSLDAVLENQKMTVYKKGEFSFSSDAGRLEGNKILLVGRDETILCINGFRFSSLEIKSYFESFSFVLDAVIYFKEFKEEGNKIDYRCYLLIKDLSKQNLYLDEIKTKINKDLVRFKHPLLFIFKESWPSSLNGKIDYKKLFDS